MAEKNCIRCGATLPDEEEGICPSCGTPFGKATMVLNTTDMAALDEAMAARDAEKAAGNGATPAPEVSRAQPLPPPPGAQPEGSGLPMIAIIGGVVLILAMIGLLIYLTSIGGAVV